LRGLFLGHINLLGAGNTPVFYHYMAKLAFASLLFETLRN
jgi:hypothetical protein